MIAISPENRPFDPEYVAGSKRPVLVFGAYDIRIPSDWTVVDIKCGTTPQGLEIFQHDLLQDDWPWHDVGVIHCASMLYQWPRDIAQALIGRCHRVLSDGGILWLSEAMREVNSNKGVVSLLKPEDAIDMARTAGFSSAENVGRDNVNRATGKHWWRWDLKYETWAVRCVK